MHAYNFLQKMELSVVLWNVEGPKIVKTRRSSCSSTIQFWKEHKVVPTVVLAQEVKGSIRALWAESSAKSLSKDNREAACYFTNVNVPGAENPDVKILESSDLIKIKDKMPYNLRAVDVARIQCAIMTIGSEKILICSWHGRWNSTKNRIELLQNMLIFVNKIKMQEDCVAALVGGDFNLNSDIARQAMHQLVLSAVLHDYENPPYRGNNLFDYVIAWPSYRIPLNSCTVIDTSPPQPEVKEARMFDHALIKYEFTVKLKGKWEGEGKVTWRGECGEGKVCVDECTLEALAYVDIEGVNGKWEGSAKKGYCKHFGKMKIKGGFNMRVKATNGWILVRRNKVYTLTQADGDEVMWKGDGEIEWESAGEIDVHIEGESEQIVNWGGTGSVKWMGKGDASWLGGKLETWSGRQTVKWADDQQVRWSGGGEVVFYGWKLNHFNCSGRWKLVTESVLGVLQHRTWCARKRIENILEWAGRGVTWKVTGKGTGEML